MVVSVPKPNAQQIITEITEELSGEPETLRIQNTVTSQWYRFFQSLWLRTGGAIDKVSEAAPIGCIIQTATVTVPDGWLPCRVPVRQIATRANACGWLALAGSW